VGAMPIDILSDIDEKLDQEKSLTSQGVKNGDTLTWAFRNETLSVKIVSENDESAVRTVTIAEICEVKSLRKYVRAEFGVSGKCILFRCNDCVADNGKDRLVEALQLKDGDTISWRSETDEQRRVRLKGDIVGSVTVKGPKNAMSFELEFGDNETVGRFGYRIAHAVNFVGDSDEHIIVRDSQKKKMENKDATLVSFGVKDGDSLSWKYQSKKELISVKIVSEKDASEVRTVKMAKDTKTRDLFFYVRTTSKERGPYSFRCNGCVSEQKKDLLVEKLKLKEGDTISWRIKENKKKSEGKKRLREESEDTEMSSPPQKRQRIK